MSFWNALSVAVTELVLKRVLRQQQARVLYSKHFHTRSEVFGA